MEKIKNFIKKHDKLNAIARCCMNINDPRFVKLIKGYYEESCEYTSILAVHNGERYPDEIIYYINFYVPRMEKASIKSGAGFCSLLRRTLQCLSFSDFLGMTPVVEWGCNLAYYDSDMDSITTNVFEYYFEPVSHIPYKDVENCKNIVEAYRLANSSFFMGRASNMPASYQVGQDEIEKLGYLYKKYIRLNKNTKEYIKESINSVLKNGRILAVHVRGTDFGVGIKNHPIGITVEEYLTKVKEIYSQGEYDRIFLATDDLNALETFKQEFNDELLYYKDVFRTKDQLGPHSTPSERPRHHYKLGLEVLRDIYTLANCDALICGLSQVSFAARYVNIAIDRNFQEVVILDNGMRTKDSDKVKNFRRQFKKINRID